MAEWATTLFFEGYQTATVGAGAAFGWSETYYQEVGDADAALRAANADVQGPGTNLCILRRAMMPDTYRIAFIRVTDIRNPNVVKVQAPNALFGTVVTIKGGPQVQCAVLANFTRLPSGPDSKSHHRKMLFRALPQGLVNGNVIDTADGNYNRVLQFLNLIGRKQSGTAEVPGAPLTYWRMAYQDPTVIYQNITALTLEPADSRFAVLTAPGLGPILRNDRITIRGVTAPRGMNRTWRATADALAGAPITLGRTSRPLDAVAVSFVGAVAVKKRVITNPPNQYAVIGLRTKKTGRPTKLLRGRRSATIA